MDRRMFITYSEERKEKKKEIKIYVFENKGNIETTDFIEVIGMVLSILTYDKKHEFASEG